MGLNDKCPVHGNAHPDIFCPNKMVEVAEKQDPDMERVVCRACKVWAGIRPEDGRCLVCRSTDLIPLNIP